MKISNPLAIGVLAALDFALVGGAHAQSATTEAYALQSPTTVVKNLYGECVRTGSWTREQAIKECDPSLFPAPVVTAPAATPAPLAAEPAPAVVAAAPEAAAAPGAGAVAAAAAGTSVAALTPATDSDGDGVADGADRCPNTRSGAKVDANGCEMLVLEGVNFETNSARLTSGSLATLDAVAAALIRRGDVKAEVAGFTDDRGKAESNQVLSQNRAEAVKKYLVSKGVDPASLTAHGYGEERPIADNSTEPGRAANRRVELHAQ
ncbi:MAG TPA: OmpA family protein [Burkholderiales bacterium]|nr:OmpA family protein [Burkholderiales bacterium]